MSQFDRRISVNTIIENQLPEFILADFPNATEFFKQYYISQEFQGGTTDLNSNFDQYLKVDNLVPEVVVGVTSITSTIFPQTESVAVVGGEELDPPQFGKVQISIKPKNGTFVSDFDKTQIKNKLKSYAIAGINSEIVDLKILYVELDSYYFLIQH